MTATLYPAGKESLLKADIDLEVSTVKIQAVSAAYVYSDAHDFFNDVAGGARIGTAQTLTGKAYDDGVFSAAALSYTGGNGEIIVAFIGFIDTGNEATSNLMWYGDRKVGAVLLSYTCDGDPFPISWNEGKVFNL